MNKMLSRLGLKFSKDRPEIFSCRNSHIVGILRDATMSQVQFEQLLHEIRNAKTSQRETVVPILTNLAKLKELIKDALESTTKVRSSQLKESRDFSKEIEGFLAEKDHLTFSEIQEQLNMTAPTLSSHLEKLVSQDKLERTVIGRNVVYRLQKTP